MHPLHGTDRRCRVDVAAHALRPQAPPAGRAERVDRSALAADVDAPERYGWGRVDLAVAAAPPRDVAAAPAQRRDRSAVVAEVELAPRVGKAALDRAAGVVAPE